MTATELEALNHYNRKILKYDESPDIILKCLGKLSQVQVNIALLQNTGIGRTVSALKKKYGESDVGTIAKELVLKWKNVVAKEEEELENEDSEVNENDNDDNENNTTPTSLSQSSDYVTPSYNTHSSEPQETRTVIREEDSSTQDEEQTHVRKSKKKKSHRQRSEEKSSSRREEKERKERHREKSHKHKSSEKDRESRHHSRAREHKSSKASVESNSSGATKDVKKEKCDKDNWRQQGEKSKHKSETSSSSGRRQHDRRELTSPQDLSSIDMFKNIVEDCDKEPKSKKRSSHSDDREDVPSSKRGRMEPPARPSTGASSLSLGPSLIPDISPIYKPLPRVNMAQFEKAGTDDRNKDEESLSLLLSNKSKGRAAIYSGEKRKGYARGSEVPSLFSQCLQILKDNVEYIEEVGGLGYDILKPVLIMANAQTLIRIEDTNPHLMEDTAELWEKFVKKEFYNKKRAELESWREMYERCVEERAEKLNALKGRVKQTYKKEEDSHRKTKLAYVDVAPKAPRSIRNAQVKHGTALPSGTPMVAGGPRPRNAMGDPTANSSRAGFTSKKPKTAPLMAKTFKLMRGIKGGFRR